MSGAHQARVCLYRAFQRGQVLPYQHADRTERAGKNIAVAGQDAAHQPLSHQQPVVPGRFARLWLCEGQQGVA